MIKSMSLLLVGISLFSINLFADQGFYKPEEVKAEDSPRYLQELLKASVYLDDGSKSHCTGSFISNDGYFLTALHCLERCLVEQNNADAFESAEFNVSGVIVKNQTPQNLFCPEISLPKLGLSNPQVIAAGKALIDYDETLLNHRHEVFYELKSKGVSKPVNDFVILKFQVKNNVACAKVSDSRNLSIGERLYGITFPRKVERDNGKGSDGVSQYISFGNVNSGILGTAYYKENVATKPFYKTEWIAEKYLTDELLFSSVDAQEGSSGGMIVNSAGEIVSIVSGALRDPKTPNSDYRPDTVSLKTSVIVEKLKNLLPVDQLNSVFGCR